MWDHVVKVPCATVTIEGPLYLEQEGLKVAKHLCVICAAQVSGQRIKLQKDNLCRGDLDHARKIITNSSICACGKWRKHVKMTIVALYLGTDYR